MEEITLSEESIFERIYVIRGVKVMLDSDLALLYGTETKRVKEQVKRNLKRFPAHYMFELTSEESEALRSQNATLKRGTHSKYLPYAFSEHGILMLSNVLKSERAILVSIQIIDVFVKLRQALIGQNELWLEIERIKKSISNQDKNMEIVFRYLDELMERKNEPRKGIGYKPNEF